MIIEPDYRGFRIEVVAQLSEGTWDAEVRIRRTLTEEPPHVETITCRKPDGEGGRGTAAVWARRWVDCQEPTA